MGDEEEQEEEVESGPMKHIHIDSDGSRTLDVCGRVHLYRLMATRSHVLTRAAGVPGCFA